LLLLLIILLSFIVPPKEHFEYYDLATSQQSAQAYKNFGACYEVGKGVE
jgi:TPR repeat protein